MNTSCEQDQFDFYLNNTRMHIDNKNSLFAWWYKDINTHSELRQMAIDVLFISAMSAEIERIFSSAKRLLVPQRQQLSTDTIEELKLLKNWHQNGLILWRVETRREPPEALEANGSRQERRGLYGQACRLLSGRLLSTIFHKRQHRRWGLKL